MEINIELFRKEYEKIEEKINQIDIIPRLHGSGGHFVSMTFEDDGISYNTEDVRHCSCCSPDAHSLYVKWEDLNKPIEFFREKFQKEIDDRNKKQQLLKLKEEAQEEEREKTLALKLKEKYNL